MARKKTARKQIAKSPAKKVATKVAKKSARKPVGKKASPKTARGRSPAKATRAPRGRAAASRRAATAAGDGGGVFKRLLDRIKPLFNKPLDPRIKHMVEVFGVEAVAGLMDAYRRKQDAAHRDELVATLNALDGRPALFRHGAWAWHELMTSDTAAAKMFYRDMFGWQASDIEMMPGFHYTTFAHNGTDVGGMMAIGPEHGGMQPGWGVYIAVDDVDSAADKAEALGGEIVVPAHNIPVGRWAMVKDPAGAVICLYRAHSA